MKNRLELYHINRRKPIHEHKYTRYKMLLSILMVISIKRHLSNIWSSIHVLLIKKIVYIVKTSNPLLSSFLPLLLYIL